MKELKKLAISISFVSSLCAAQAFAAHFTVGGSTNGTFQITGSLQFGHETGPGSPVTFFPANETDVDTPQDNGTPVTILPDDVSLNTMYTCPVTLSGNVTNGVANITSVHVDPSSIVCSRISQNISNLPWKFHALSTTNDAMLSSITFYSPATFSCPNTITLVTLTSGTANFRPAGEGGCYVANYDWLPLTVTPALEIAYP